MSQESVFLLLRRESDDNFLEAWIAAQGIPVRMKLKKTVAELVRDAFYGGDLFDSALFLTSPRVDFRQINCERDATNGVLGNRQQFARALAFPEGPCLSSKASIDYAQEAEGRGKVGLFLQALFQLAARGAEGSMRPS